VLERRGENKPAQDSAAGQAWRQPALAEDLAMDLARGKPTKSAEHQPQGPEPVTSGRHDDGYDDWMGRADAATCRSDKPEADTAYCGSESPEVGEFDGVSLSTTENKPVTAEIGVTAYERLRGAQQSTKRVETECKTTSSALSTRT